MCPNCREKNGNSVSAFFYILTSLQWHATKLGRFCRYLTKSGLVFLSPWPFGNILTQVGREFREGEPRMRFP